MAQIVRSKWAVIATATARCEAPKCRRSVLAFALVILAPAIGIAAEKPQYFSIKMNHKLIGYAVVHGEKVTRDGRALLRLKSETSLKVALLGKERSTLLDSETLIDPEMDRPISYRMTDTTNEVVRHIESEFRNRRARVWNYRQGDARGEPVEIELPEGTVVLGSNNFAHWQLLLKAATDRAADGVAKISVFLPDAGQVDRLELTRGRVKDVSLADGTRKCVSWRLGKANLQALTDAQTNEFVRLELPGQQTTIELADESVVKLVRKSRAEEVLARHFAQSNVMFDDFLSVSALEAEIDLNVIGSGVANDSSVLTTTMQEFDGTKEAERINGTVSIHSVGYDGKDSPAFPMQSDVPTLARWLGPSVYIESDHPSIVAKSAELTKGAKTRWDAVQAIGLWVYKEIAYTIADTPSARLALDKRKGDCGPHATLTVAMLRARGIPARLVGGLVYTPTFGGSFGQHAWVEVHMGNAGWIAIDPTTGEFRQLSATHVKLFEGLGGVLPKSVKAVAFEPPNRKATPGAPSQAKPVAWKLGKEYTFKYMQGDRELGKETIAITKIEQNGEEAYELTSDVNLSVNLLTSLRSSATLVVAPNALPISFERDLSAALQKVKIECSFKDGVVEEKIGGTTNLSREVKLPAGAYCFDNNLMGCFVLMCSQLTLEPNKALTVQTFHPSTLQITPLTVTPKAPAAIEIGDKDVECFECEVAPIKNTFWISRDGRFVRAKQGDLVIEVTEVD